LVIIESLKNKYKNFPFIESDCFEHPNPDTKSNIKIFESKIRFERLDLYGKGIASTKNIARHIAA